MTAQQDGVIFPVVWQSRPQPSVDTLLGQLDAEQRAHAAAETRAAAATVRMWDYRRDYINLSRAWGVQEERLLLAIGALGLLLVVAVILGALGWMLAL